MRTQLVSAFDDIVSLENLLGAWRELARGKRGKPDVQTFGCSLMDSLLDLHEDLMARAYRHGGYRAFSIADPKPRHIHKAAVRDRVLHHAIHRILSPFFDRTFLFDSYSCRLGKGTHAALNRFRSLAYRASHNHTAVCWVLKCDVVKFFASIDHEVLLRILARYIPDRGILWLLEEVIRSFSSARPGVGLPLGNLTSQLLVNVYMNEFDQFVKHRLKARFYVRYADDFIVLSGDRRRLTGLVEPVQYFLWSRLRLRIHDDRVSVRTLASGVDFLGWVHFPDHRVLRGTTRRRMLRRVRACGASATLHSYCGHLKHGNAQMLRREVCNTQWFWQERRAGE